MKRCIVTFVDAGNPAKTWEEMVLVDSSADKYEIHSHFEDRLLQGQVITGIKIADSSEEMVFVLD